MAENMTETWTISELYSMYLAASGTVSRRQFVSSITNYFGDKQFLFQIEGCESVVGFKASLEQFIKIAKKNNSNSEDDELEKLVRKICSEFRATLRSGDNFSDYVRHKVIQSTSASLLKLISSLISGRAITKPSLTLAQCIQQHICDASRPPDYNRARSETTPQAW